MKQRRKTLLVGIAMGTADLIPGVSGGTIAFITGIYEKLLASIAACDVTTLKLALRGNWKQAWQRINGTFLVTLFLGVFIAIGVMAQIISNFLATDPHLVKGFFLGIILTSAFLLALPYKHTFGKNRIAFLVGSTIGLLLTVTQFSIGSGLISVVLGGAMASIAMILPGISGSYILVIIEKYEFILATVVAISDAIQQGAIETLFTHSRTAPGRTLLLFIAGVIIGLLSFAKLLSYILDNRHTTTVILLIGLMIGAIPAIRPRADIISPTLSENIRIVIWILIGGLVVGGVHTRQQQRQKKR